MSTEVISGIKYQFYDRPPCCPAWNRNVIAIHQACTMAAMNGHRTKLDPMRWCPWCGTLQDIHSEADTLQNQEHLGELSARIKANRLFSPDIMSRLTALIAEFKSTHNNPPQYWMLSDSDAKAIAIVVQAYRQKLPHIEDIETLATDIPKPLELLGLPVLSWTADETKVV